LANRYPAGSAVWHLFNNFYRHTVHKADCAENLHEEVMLTNSTKRIAPLAHLSKAQNTALAAVLDALKGLPPEDGAGGLGSRHCPSGR
jgi:hypothetical protein